VSPADSLAGRRAAGALTRRDTCCQMIRAREKKWCTAGPRGESWTRAERNSRGEGRRAREARSLAWGSNSTWDTWRNVVGGFLCAGPTRRGGKIRVTRAWRRLARRKQRARQARVPGEAAGPHDDTWRAVVGRNLGPRSAARQLLTRVGWVGSRLSARLAACRLGSRLLMG